MTLDLFSSLFFDRMGQNIYRGFKYMYYIFMPVFSSSSESCGHLQLIFAQTIIGEDWEFVCIVYRLDN